MTDSSSSLTTTGGDLQVFSGIAAFDAAQRMAKALSSSTLVPREYQGQQGLANSLIALEMAGRMGLSPLVVMQNLSIIHGRPSWSSSFLIATVNASGRFSPLRFIFDDPAQPSSCYAVATDKASGEELVGETITLEMAKREGWSTKNGSKWLTMPGQMLRYRAASFWARVYCPEVSLGLVTQEEAIDVEPVAVSVAAPERPRIEATVEVEPAPEPPAQPAAEPHPEQLQQPEPEQEQAVLATGDFDTASDAVQASQQDERAQLAQSAIDRVTVLATIRDLEAATTWAAANLTGDDADRMEKAIAVRRKFLSAPLTVATRQKCLAALQSSHDLAAQFLQWFGLDTDADLPSSITQRQHQEFIDAHRS